jgi:heat shock protein HslJ
MKMILTAMILVLFSCNSTKNTADMKEFPSGTYEVVTLNAKNFKAKETYKLNINTEKQSIGGTFDCNTFTCDYKIENQQIEFGFAISTKMYCEGAMQNEEAFFRNLRSLTSFKYDGNILQFFNEDNEMILKLKRQGS